jgi:phosphatidylglycerol---prolipoprotein diacylglyceryl transferase
MKLPGGNNMTNVGRMAFLLFGIPVYWYGLLIMTGVLTGLLITSLREKRFSLPKDTSINLALWVVPVAIVCARIYYVAFTWDHFKDDLWSVFNVRGGGMAIYGSLIGGFLFGIAYAKAKKLKFSSLCDLAAPAIAAGQAIGRWGNFFNQEAYGVPIVNPSFQFFPAAVWIQDQSGWFAATFFYESAWCFLIVAFLLIAERKRFFRRPGEEFLWYVSLYAFERMIVEGLRTDSLYWGPVRVSQALSFALFLVGALIILTLRKGANRMKED